MAKLNKKQRDNLPESDFAVPEKRALPIHDAEHVKLAWDMVDRTEGLTPEERKEARRRILRRAKELGIDTSGWDKGDLHAAEDMKLYASASNVLLGALEHPNKMPFTGILTYFDAPSDEAPGGARGRRVVIPAEVGIPALASLQGMAVNYAEGWDGHNPQEKIGVITKAWAGDKQSDGSVPVYVEGYIYALDFQDAAVSIKANQSLLGFSYETANTRLVDGEWKGEPVAIVTELGYFTGASILLKQSAAYKTTSIAASAEEEGGNSVADLDKVLAAIEALKEYVDTKFENFRKEDEQQDAIDEALEDAGEAVQANAEKEEEQAEKAAEEPKVEEAKEEASKDASEVEKQVEEKSDEQAHDELKAYAEKIEALEKRVESLEAEHAKLKAEAEEQSKLQAAARKSVAYPMSYVAKYGLDEKDSIENLMASIEKRDDLSIEERLAAKIELRNRKLREGK